MSSGATLTDVEGCVMDHEQNLRELNVNVTSLLPIYVKREIRECQYSPFFMILSEKLVCFSLISRETG